MVKVFVTQFPLRSSASINDFVEENMNWLAGSRYRKADRERLEELSLEGGEYTTEGPEEGVETKYKVVRYENGDYQGVGFVNSSTCRDGKVWTGTVVGSKFQARGGEDIFYASVIVDYATSLPAGEKPRSRKPGIVNGLIERLGGGDDWGIDLQMTPHYIHEYDVEETARIINGMTENILPVIYLSRNTQQLLAVDPELLSKELAGTAHVLVEPSRTFSFELKEATKGKNPYNGAVGFLWPREAARRIIFEDELKFDKDGRRYSDDRAGRNKIRISLFEALTELRVSRPLTIDFIEGQITKAKIKELEETGSSDADLVELYDAENKRLEQQLKDREERIADLGRKLGIAHSSAGARQGLISAPELSQMYEGEFKDLIHRSVEGAMQGLDHNSRRYEVLKAVVEGNPEKGERRAILDRFSKIFSNARKLTPTMRRDLGRLGFEVRDGGKNYILYHRDHSDRGVSFPKTPSRDFDGPLLKDVERKFF